MAPFNVDITQANEMDPIIVPTGEDEIKLFRGNYFELTINILKLNIFRWRQKLR